MLHFFLLGRAKRVGTVHPYPYPFYVTYMYTCPLTLRRDPTGACSKAFVATVELIRICFSRKEVLGTTRRLAYSQSSVFSLSSGHPSRAAILTKCAWRSQTSLYICLPRPVWCCPTCPVGMLWWRPAFLISTQPSLQSWGWRLGAVLAQMSSLRC